MNKFKKLSFLWFFSIILVSCFHAIVYYTYVDKVFPEAPMTIGDLGRMSYATDLLDLRENKIDLVKLHTELKEYEGSKVELITIGDSFSNGGGGGLNSYYQDYIATEFNINVLNLSNIKGANNFIEIVSSFLNSGQLEVMKTKYVLIESVQRFALQRFAINNIDFQKNEIYSFLKQEDNKNTKVDKSDSDIGIINNLNLNALSYNLKFKLEGYGKISSNIYREKINKNLFSTKISDELLFYYEDLKFIDQESKDKIELLNNNFNILSKALAQKNIKLIFMPAVDKYNLYRPYIVSNIYKESIFFEYLETLPKDYIFINTKKILSKELENGEKDIFYVDDTHWSYRASEVIIKDESFKNIFR